MSDENNKFCRRGLVICVSGPSGVGKGTVIRKVMETRSGMVHSISVTTRSPRPGERDGVEYFFKSRDEFEAMLARGEILESDTYCGHYYGTPRRYLEIQVSQGIDVLLDITVPGSLAIMKNFPESVPIFLLPPSFSELARRLEKRGTENPDERLVRLEKAREEISKARLFRYIIINDNLTETAGSILAITTAEHCRYDRCPGFEESILSH